MSALTGIRVVELAESVAGEYCGKLLADFGAEVIKIEAPGCGSPTRAMAPIVGDAGCEGSALFAYLNTNKHSVVLDITSAADVERLHEHRSPQPTRSSTTHQWAEAAGLSRPVPNDTRTWCSARSPRSAMGRPPSSKTPRASTCSTPAAGDITLPAMPTPPSRRCRGPADSSPTTKRVWRRRCALRRRCSGVCIAARANSSIFRSMPCWCHAPTASWADSSPARSRPKATAAITTKQGPASFFACADGFVYLYMTSRAHWLGVKALMGHPEWLDAFDDDWLEFSVTAEKVATFQRGFAAWVRDLAKDAAAEQAQRLGVPLVPVNGAADLHHSPQYRHRGFFQQVRHPVLGDAAYPTVPYALSASPAEITSAAPTLGQHTALVLDRLDTPHAAAGGQVGTTQATQRSARRPAGRGTRRRAHQGVGRSRMRASCWRCWAPR